MTATLKRPLLRHDILHMPSTGGWLLVTRDESADGQVWIAVVWVEIDGPRLHGVQVYQVLAQYAIRPESISVDLLASVGWVTTGVARDSHVVRVACGEVLL